MRRQQTGVQRDAAAAESGETNEVQSSGNEAERGRLVQLSKERIWEGRLWGMKGRDGDTLRGSTSVTRRLND